MYILWHAHIRVYLSSAYRYISGPPANVFIQIIYIYIQTHSMVWGVPCNTCEARGPLISLYGFHPTLIKPCSMHVVNLGISMHTNASALFPDHILTQFSPRCFVCSVIPGFRAPLHGFVWCAICFICICNGVQQKELITYIHI